MTRKRTVQVFIVSWFPMYATVAATIMCLSRERAQRVVGELEESFKPWPDYNPAIHVDRTEVPVNV